MSENISKSAVEKFARNRDLLSCVTFLLPTWFWLSWDFSSDTRIWRLLWSKLSRLKTPPHTTTEISQGGGPQLDSNFQLLVQKWEKKALHYIGFLDCWGYPILACLWRKPLQMTEVMICSLGFDGQLCMEHQLQNWSANDGGMYQENTAFCTNSKCTKSHKIFFGHLDWFFKTIFWNVFLMVEMSIWFLLQMLISRS